MASATAPTPVLTAPELLQHWQGHRKLTRKMIELFPDDKLFTFSVGGMRPFGALVQEFIGMAVPVMDGARTGTWEAYADAKAESKHELLAIWDAQTKMLNERFPQIPPHRFAEVDKAFGQWESANINTILYAIDNEIHHRGQGYVYLRALGIKPPDFWDRD